MAHIVDLTIKFKNYLAEVLKNPKYIEKICNTYKNVCSNNSIACLYCKEIVSVITTTGQFNCSFKPLSKTQYDLYEQKMPSNHTNKNKILMLAILSNESTNKMITHEQFIIKIVFDIIDHSFMIDDKEDKVTINQYDPILSKSKTYDGLYINNKNAIEMLPCAQCNPLSSVCSIDVDVFCTQCTLKKIIDDNMESISKEVQNHYKNKFYPMSKKEKKDDIIKIFPFMQESAVDRFLQGRKKTTIFFYMKVTLDNTLYNVLSDAFKHQDFSQLLNLFPRLTSDDINMLAISEGSYKQYELFHKLTSNTEKGLSYDELISLMVRKINQNIVNKTLFDFQKELFDPNYVGEIDEDEHPEEDYDY